MNPRAEWRTDVARRELALRTIAQAEEINARPIVVEVAGEIDPLLEVVEELSKFREIRSEISVISNQVWEHDPKIPGGSIHRFGRTESQPIDPHAADGIEIFAARVAGSHAIEYRGVIAAMRELASLEGHK